MKTSQQLLIFNRKENPSLMQSPIAGRKPCDEQKT
jgi:hypothetical protein